MRPRGILPLGQVCPSPVYTPRPEPPPSGLACTARGPSPRAISLVSRPAASLPQTPAAHTHRGQQAALHPHTNRQTRTHTAGRRERPCRRPAALRRTCRRAARGQRRVGGRIQRGCARHLEPHQLERPSAPDPQGPVSHPSALLVCFFLSQWRRSTAPAAQRAQRSVCSAARAALGAAFWCFMMSETASWGGPPPASSG